MKIFNIVLAALLLVGTLSCTENERAKKYGGTMTVNVPKGNKLEGATWKGDEVWYLYRPFREGEKPETHILAEDSRFGLLTGKVQFIEQ